MRSSRTGRYASLTYTGRGRAGARDPHRCVGPDGTISIFRPIGGEDCADQNWSSVRRRCAFVSEMTEPDGTRYMFDYVAAGGGAGNRARLARVTSSRGYALLLEGQRQPRRQGLPVQPRSGSGAGGRLGLPGGRARHLELRLCAQPHRQRLASATSPGGGDVGFTYGGRSRHDGLRQAGPAGALADQLGSAG